jgi:hypothetical protein
MDPAKEILFFALQYHHQRRHQPPPPPPPLSISPHELATSLSCSLRAAKAICHDLNLMQCGKRTSMIISSCAPDPYQLASAISIANLGVVIGGRDTLFIVRPSQLRLRAYIFTAGAIGGIPLMLLVAARYNTIPAWPVDIYLQDYPSALQGVSASEWFFRFSNMLTQAADALRVAAINHSPLVTRVFDKGEEEEMDENNTSSTTTTTIKICPVALAGTLLNYPCIYDVNGGAKHCLGNSALQVYTARAAAATATPAATTSDNIVISGSDVGTLAFSTPLPLLTGTSSSPQIIACVSAWKAAMLGIDMQVTEMYIPKGSALAI